MIKNALIGSPFPIRAMSKEVLSEASQELMFFHAHLINSLYVLDCHYCLAVLKAGMFQTVIFIPCGIQYYYVRHYTAGGKMSDGK